MYCEGCGTQIQSGLNYCSRCGRRVAEDSKWSKHYRTNPLVVAGQTAGVGFFGFIFVLLILAKSGVSPNLFVPITFFYFAALFGICFMILSYGRSLTKTEAFESPIANTTEPAYLRPVTTAQLEEAREFGVCSITDATTRTLSEVPISEKR
jgi:hypothetical protein